MGNYCVCCGQPIPEGKQVCQNCEEIKGFKMIEIEGFKAFHGKILITPRSPLLKPFEIESDWLYKPTTNCWYDGESCFPAEICKVVKV